MNGNDQIFSDMLNNGPTLAERTTLEAHVSFGRVSTARSSVPDRAVL